MSFKEYNLNLLEDVDDVAVSARACANSSLFSPISVEIRSCFSLLLPDLDVYVFAELMRLHSDYFLYGYKEEHF